MRVQLWPADAAGCGSYRLIYVAEALQNQGHDVVVNHQGPKIGWDRVWSTSEQALDARILQVAPVEADMVVMQRTFRAHWVELIPHLHAQGITVAVDIDDDFTPGVLPTTNAAWPAINPKGHPRHNWRWFQKVLQQADLVTVSTPALAARYRGAVVLPNYIPARHLVSTVRPAHQPVRIGWSGNLASHPDDLRPLSGTVQQVADATGAEFAHIGVADGVAQALRLTSPMREIGPKAFGDYHQALDEFDIGVVPLAPIAFNRSKSRLKGIEYSARGIPFVASPTPEYVQLHADGAGLLASKPREWIRHLTRLATSEDDRQELGFQALEVARANTYEDHAWRWWAAWALTRHSTRRTA